MPPKNVNKNKKNSQTVAVVRGNGNYYTDKIVPVMQQIVPKGTFARGGEYVGGAGGSILGTKYGQASLGRQLGSTAGRLLGNGLSRIVGFGDYTVENNSLFKEGMALAPGEAVPSFGMIGNATRVRHREYLQDIVVPAVAATFTNVPFTINAGSVTTFPWLSALAQNYQQYRIHGMVFEFKTLSSDITAGGPLGSVILATNYDVLDAPYADKIHMENAEFSVSAKPSCSQLHTIECDPSVSTDMMRYIRDDQSSTGASQDARLYDLGKFQIATSGLPGTPGTVLGELWCSYDISLYKPEIVDRNAGSAKVVASGIISTVSLMGSSNTTTSTPGFVISTSVNTVTFTTTGQYELTFVIQGTTVFAMTLTGTSSPVTLSNSPTGQSVLLQIVRVNITASGQTLILADGGSGAVTANTMRVASYLYSLA